MLAFQSLSWASSVIAVKFAIYAQKILFQHSKTLSPHSSLTCQMLVESGMKEILVLCRAHEDKINKHISNSPCWESNVRCKVTTKSVAHCRTVGDCIRDVQESALINGDFVLVYGDVVSNLNLSSFIEKHKARYIEDKANIMTMLFKVTEPDHPLRSAENDFAVALGDTDRMDDSFRLLSYVKKHEGESSKSFDFPKEIFAESTTVQLRNNFLDAQIYICSQEVLILFADEFDIEDMFGSIRFIHTDEIRCERIYCHIIEDEYAARVSDINAYDIISKDIICRWTHPLVPDVFRPHGKRRMAVDGISRFSRSISLARALSRALSFSLVRNFCFCQSCPSHSYLFVTPLC